MNTRKEIGGFDALMSYTSVDNSSMWPLRLALRFPLSALRSSVAGGM